jgi:type IV secretory pathway TrbF-like protein/predicted MFS family arabinose efflux permease
MSGPRQPAAAANPQISITEPVAEPLATASTCSAPASLSILQQSGGTRRQNWRLILRVFLPFTAAFFLSYLFRTINALISSELSSELALDAADLGFLTSVYFLTFAALQLPIGIWLDRYGPRRVQGALLLFAAAGAILFSLSKGFAALVLGRALVGLGVAAAFTCGLKAIILWFPRDRVAVMNGWMVMLGALGALSATSPAELLLDLSGGWRGLFAILAAVTVASALTIWVVVPEATSAMPSSNEHGPISLKIIYSDPRFWRLAPLSATCAGTAWALQGLWATPWLTDVDRLPPTDVTRHLLVIAIVQGIAALLLGSAADRLRRRGVGPQVLLGFVATTLVAAQLALILHLPVSSYLPWSIVAAAGSGPILSYAILAEYFPREITGRANGALNVFHFGAAFIIQYFIGVIVAQWPSQDGHYPAIAYQLAFGLNLCLQTAALAWLAFSRVRARELPLVSAFRHRAHRRARIALGFATPSLHPMKWWDRLNSAQRQVSHWRLAALGSASLVTLLGLTLAVSIVRANVTSSTVAAHRDERSAVLSKMEATAPSDAQIAYFLTGFVKNVKSLSVDPVVVRANWIDALDHVTARGARTLNACARDESPFTKIGRRTVTVVVTKVVRAAEDAFEIRWQERILETGAPVKHERFTGTVSIVVGSPNTPELMSKNPLGLYVDRFTWWRDSIGDRADEWDSSSFQRSPAIQASLTSCPTIRPLQCDGLLLKVHRPSSAIRQHG